MALSHAARQRCCRPRQKTFRRQAQRPQSWAQGWSAAVHILLALQREYQPWLDHSPEAFRE
jgi:hypothetical protein